MKGTKAQKSNKGITLIALVVTIIVLLILAGVSIQMLTGQTGILRQAQQAKEDTIKGEIRDDVRREILERMTDNLGNVSKTDLYEILDKYFDLEHSGEEKNIVVKAPDAYTEGEENPWEVEDFPESFPELHSKEGNYPFKLGDLYSGDLSGTQTGNTTPPTTGEKPGNPKENGIFTKNSTIDGKAGSYDNPTIPAGFRPVNPDYDTTVGDANWGNGDSKPEEKALNAGLVIEDEEQNQFVWVPVPTVVGNVAREVAIDITTTPMAEESGSNYKGILYHYWNFTTKKVTALIEEVETIGSGDLAFDEPFTFPEDSSYGMTDDLQEKYNEMVESVSTYGGFYVGRYEMSLSSDTTKKAQYKRGETSATGKVDSANMWYGLYEKQKEFATKYSEVNSTIKSSMIWGSQYDAMMNWMIRCGKDITKAISNYNKTRSTGTVETDKINNIYDLYGNSYEWTLERTYNTFGSFPVSDRTSRAGYNSYYGGSPSGRNYWYGPDQTTDYGSRASLYL